MEFDDYEIKVNQQIAQYLDSEIHDLPQIFHVWSHNFVRSGIEDVFGVSSITNLYASAAGEASGDFTRFCNILSVGCGDGSVEIDVAKALLEAGRRDFRITGLDLSPVLIDRFKEKMSGEHLHAFVNPVAADLNKIGDLGRFNMIMANHSLHHMIDLENLFSSIATALEPGGIFATCDMIGRNGHMRWPEAEAPLQAIWPMLTERQRFHHQLRRFDEHRFVDHDCSGEGFEGIRAQDILALILERFKAYKFFGYGGFIDVLVDRGYGPGYNADDERDRAFIVGMAQINDMMLDAGMMKPTTMMAYFTVDERGERYYRERRASTSVRDPAAEPSWPHYRL